MTKDERRLSARVRPNVEAAPWVVDAIQKLEAELDAAKVTAFTACPNCGAGLDDGQCRECIESDAWLREQNAMLTARVQRLTYAAQAVVERWDTPSWKDAEPTAATINRLRAALAEGEDTHG